MAILSWLDFHASFLDFVILLEDMPDKRPKNSTIGIVQLYLSELAQTRFGIDISARRIAMVNEQLEVDVLAELLIQVARQLLVLEVRPLK